MENKKTIILFSDTLLDDDSRVIQQINFLANHYNVIVVSKMSSNNITREYPDNVRFIKIKTKQIKSVASTLYNLELNKKKSFKNKVISYLLRRKLKYSMEELFIESNKSYGDLHEQVYDYLNEWKLAKSVCAIYVNGTYCLAAALLLKNKLTVKNENNIILISNLHESYSNYIGKTTQQSIPVIKRIINRSDLMISISKKIVEEYVEKLSYKKDTLVVNNVENYVDINPQVNNSNKIELVHLVTYNENERIYKLLDIMDKLEGNYTLNLYLMTHNSIKGQVNFLKLIDYIQNSELQERVKIHKQVKHSEIILTLNKYDIGIIFADNKAQNKSMLPNELFKFIQSRIAVVATNQVSMKELINKYDVGISCEAKYDSFVATIKKVASDLDRYKKNSDKASKILNFENQFQSVIDYIEEKSEVLDLYNEKADDEINYTQSALILSDSDNLRIQREVEHFLKSYNVVVSSPDEKISFLYKNLVHHKVNFNFEDSIAEEMHTFLKNNLYTIDDKKDEFLKIYRRLIPASNCGYEVVGTLSLHDRLDDLKIVFCNNILYLPELTNKIKSILPNHIKYWVDFHEVYFENKKPGSLDDLLFKYILNNFLESDYMYSSVSDEIATKYAKLYNIDVTRILPVPDFFIDKSVIEKNYNEKIDLVYVNSASPNQKIEDIIKAMNKLDEKYHLHLYLSYKKTGLSRESFVKFEDLVKKENLSNRVHFHKNILDKKLIKDISQYDIALFYLVLEVNGYNPLMQVKLFEYIQAGLGIVALPTSSMKDIVEGYEVGCISEKNDIETLVSSIIEVTNNIEYYKMMSQKASNILNFENEFKKVDKFLNKK